MIKLTDREVLFVCYGAIKGRATRRELNGLVDTLEKHLFPKADPKPAKPVSVLPDPHSTTGGCGQGTLL